MSYIKQYRIISHGLNTSDYFQGQGTTGTEFTEAFTGIGSSEYDALYDALNQTATAGDYDNIDEIENNLSDDDYEPETEEDELQYFVSVLFNLAEETDKNRFNEMINDTSETDTVEIAGISLSIEPCELLEQHDPIAYCCCFSDYMDGQDTEYECPECDKRYTDIDEARECCQTLCEKI